MHAPSLTPPSCSRGHSLDFVRFRVVSHPFPLPLLATSCSPVSGSVKCHHTRHPQVWIALLQVPLPPRPPIPSIPLIHAWPLAIKRSMSKLADKKGQMNISHQTPHDFVLFTWYHVQHRCVCPPFLRPCNNSREITPARCQVVLDNYWPDHLFPFQRIALRKGDLRTCIA